MGRPRKSRGVHTYRELSFLKEAAVYTEFIVAYIHDHQSLVNEGIASQMVRCLVAMKVENRGFHNPISRVEDREASFDEF